MSSAAFARIARARLLSQSSYRLRPTSATRIAAIKPSSFSTASSVRMPAGDPHDPHHEESFEEFTARYGIHPPGGIWWCNGCLPGTGTFCGPVQWLT